MLRINVGFHFNIFTVDSSIILLKTVNIFTTVCNSYFNLKCVFGLIHFEIIRDQIMSTCI